jgi:hypothetical protein
VPGTLSQSALNRAGLGGNAPKGTGQPRDLRGAPQSRRACAAAGDYFRNGLTE